MNTFFYSCCFLFLLTACGTGEVKTDPSGKVYAEIEFEKKVYDFGEIGFDTDGRCYFEFTNDSETPLIINTVRTTCGCTRPEWPEKPVKPGETGRIGITYNTKLTGTFHKSITVYANTLNSPIKLHVKGKVLEKIASN